MKRPMVYSPLMSVTTTCLPLLTGAQIPQVGFGVWEVPTGATTHQSVTAELERGGDRLVRGGARGDLPDPETDLGNLCTGEKREARGGDRHERTIDHGTLHRGCRTVIPSDAVRAVHAGHSTRWA